VCSSQEIDQRFHLINRYERRCIVAYLGAMEQGHASLDEVVRYLQGQEPIPDDPDVILAELHHNHLPKLADSDLSDFDPRSGTVRYYGDDLVENLLDTIPETHPPRQ
jgi:hypothetical protein